MELDRRGCVVQPSPRANRRREEPADKAKPFDIPKRDVWEAFKRVKANQGAAGVDRQSITDFEADLSNNLYKLWNRLSSGSYFPPPVRRVEIPKADGGTRPLGIPTVADRIAQEVARRYLEPYLEAVFHTDSYGYRPGRSAIDAVRQARQRCWRYDWALDIDVKAYFDSIDWERLLKAVRHHTDCTWVLLYIERVDWCSGSKSRAGGGGAGVARAGDQHGGSGCRFVARFWPVAAASLSLPRGGSGGRAGAGDRRDLDDDYAQDSAQPRTGAAGLLREQRADPERDRTTCDIGVSVGSARTWLSGATSRRSVSNTPLTVCSSPSSSRSIRSSSPIGFGSSARAAS